jgi:hypothetical protein
MQACCSGNVCNSGYECSGSNRCLAAEVSPTSIPDKVVGDANGDGSIDLSDQSIWKEEYLGQVGTRADFDKSGKVDLIDLDMWKKAYLRM